MYVSVRFIVECTPPGDSMAVCYYLLDRVCLESARLALTFGICIRGNLTSVPGTVEEKQAGKEAGCILPRPRLFLRSYYVIYIYIYIYVARVQVSLKLNELTVYLLALISAALYNHVIYIERPIYNENGF